MKGGAYTLAATPQIARDFLTRVSKQAQQYLQIGNFQEKEVERPAVPDGGIPYTDLTQDLADRLTEYELVDSSLSEELWVKTKMGPCLFVSSSSVNVIICL